MHSCTPEALLRAAQVKSLNWSHCYQIKKGSSIDEICGRKKAVLVLEDGSFEYGNGFGAIKKISGEVVFNTGMVGYTESITDPSYKGQILLQTYPLIGNYGVNIDDFESNGPKIEGYIIHEMCRRPNHWTSRMTLEEFLEKYETPGIEGIDTRALTKKIRSHGTMLGILQVYYENEKPCIEDLLEEVKRIQDPNETDLVNEVCTKKVIRHSKRAKLRTVLIDCGVKKSIIKNLIDRNTDVIQVPPSFNTEDIISFKPDGVVISNGPGDPKRVSYLTKAIEELIQHDIPILGICLGAQLIALTFKGDTYKLKFGHRGQNHPCIEIATGKCYITSQNHGYAIDPESLTNSELEVTFRNANDNTVEGIAHKSASSEIFAFQWHPEASPGPYDTQLIFDQFIRGVKNAKI